MTSTIRTILKDPTTGLLPYLDTQIGAGWGNHNIKPYSFKTPGNQSGYRLPDSTPSAIPGNGISKRQTLILGRLLPMKTFPESIDVAEFSNALIGVVLHWAKCKCPHLRGEVLIRREIIDREQVNNQGAHDINAFWWVLILTIEFEYVESV